MSDIKTIRYFVKFEASTGYALFFKRPGTLGELKKLMELSAFEFASQLLFIDDVKTDPEVMVDVHRFNSLVNELLSMGLEHCGYFSQSIQGEERKITLVLRVKYGALNRYIAPKTIPFFVKEATLIDLINSVDQLTELLEVD
jgi:hypothetical protein